MPITLDTDILEDPYEDVWDDNEHRQCEDPAECWVERMGE